MSLTYNSLVRIFSKTAQKLQNLVLLYLFGRTFLKWLECFMLTWRKKKVYLAIDFFFLVPYLFTLRGKNKSIALLH